MSSDPNATATVETRVARLPTASQPSSGSAPGGSTTGRVTTPSEALAIDEGRRMQMLALFAALTCVFAATAMLPMQGHLAAKIGHAGALLACGLCGTWVYFRLRDPDRYTTWVICVFSGFTGVALTSAYLFWGIYSSAVLFVVIVIYFFSGTKSHLPTLVTLLSAGIPHLVLGVLTSFGVMDDVGVVRSATLSSYEKLAVILNAQFAFVVTYALARMTRRSMTDVVEQLDGAVRGIAKREALLAEAKQDLERALQIGGPGLYTDQTLGSFRLGPVLGRGAMGEVYEATHIDTGERAAVKVLPPSAGSEPALVRRFLREVEIAASLDSPHVVRVLEIPPSSSTLPYLAMELLEGESLAEILRKHPRMKIDRVVELMREICDGIEAAHRAGIIHRDLKPRNVFRHKQGRQRTWKILDFGVSKLAGQSGTLTKGHLVGTPSYMAPEQARGHEVDERADIYSLGVLAYRALTGRPAFSGADVPSILYAVTHDMPPRPGEMAKLPAAVDRVLAVALAKRPGQRFASATELAEALASAADGIVAADVVKRAAEVLDEHPWGHRG